MNTKLTKKHSRRTSMALTKEFQKTHFFSIEHTSTYLKTIPKAGFILFCFFVFPLFSGTSIPQEPETPTIEWLSFEEMIEKSKTSPKKVLIDVYTDWCGWCRRMDSETFSNPEIIEYVNDHFYAVKFNGESEEIVELYGQQYTFVPSSKGKRGYNELAMFLTNGKLSYPTTAFWDYNHTNLDSFEGYKNIVDMDIILHFIKEGHYRRSTFEDFKKTFKSQISY